MNKVILLGYVGKEPEIKTANENQVATFSLATSESYKDKNGNKQTNTEWHNITIWGGLVKVVENYVNKGTQLLIEGKIRYRKYEKDGETKYFTEILASNFKMLGSKGNNDNFNQQPNECDFLPF